MKKDQWQPIYFTKGNGTEAQEKKINQIVTSMYSTFKNNTKQKQIGNIVPWQITKEANSNVGQYLDQCYEQFCTLSFYFNTSGYDENYTPIVFKIKKGSILSDITFVGVDRTTINDEDTPDYLNNYGYFIFTKNSGLDERYISFKPFKECPSLSWNVSMSFQYIRSEN